MTLVFLKAARGFRCEYWVENGSPFVVAFKNILESYLVKSCTTIQVLIELSVVKVSCFVSVVHIFTNLLALLCTDGELVV